MLNIIYSNCLLEELKNIDAIIDKMQNQIIKYACRCERDTMRQFEKITTMIINKNIYEILRKNGVKALQSIKNRDIIFTKCENGKDSKTLAGARKQFNKAMSVMGYDDEVIDEVFMKIPRFKSVLYDYAEHYGRRLGKRILIKR